VGGGVAEQPRALLQQQHQLAVQHVPVWVFPQMIGLKYQMGTDRESILESVLGADVLVRAGQKESCCLH
jgi:hypothetical protein